MQESWLPTIALEIKYSPDKRRSTEKKMVPRYLVFG